MHKQNMSICLWFDNQAEEAAKFYTSIFKDSKPGAITHFKKEGFEYHGKPEGSVMTVEFELNGMAFLALNGGPLFKFNESMSVMVYCDTQEDVDYYWEKLTEEGTESMCGWLKDKFGVSWQIIPREMGEYYNAKDKEKSSRAVNAMFQMKKLDINEIKKAFNGN
ncbi:MAG: VOC family protein [Deferribacteres bacterium]|nr:VOC family protein [candidate division KSB1 bacterium]MCB9502288.1 VOC family protein [Deferribacteres bacterium]